MIVKLDKQIVHFKVRRNENFIRVFFEEKKMYIYMKSLLNTGKNLEPFDKLILDFSKQNIFLIVEEKMFPTKCQKESNWNFFKVLHDGKTFWARSEMFEKV
jgi:hypothetical protein